MNNESPLDQLSLCTFCTSSSMVREVLEDWFNFIGGKAKQVIFAVAPADNPPQIYQTLQAEGLIDEIIYLKLNSQSKEEIRAIDLEAIKVGIKAAKTKWVLLVKLDTLPFCTEPGDWLSHAIQIINHYNCLGLTGSGSRYDDLQPLEKDYWKTQKFSNNFALFRQSDWLEVWDSYIGDDFEGQLFKNTEEYTGNLRFVTEVAMEKFMQDHHQYMIMREESLQWSVFHVNVWEEQLQKVRERYLRREGVKAYLNTRKSPRQNLIHPWQRYYGYPQPSTVEQLRIWLGTWRGKIFQ